MGFREGLIAVVIAGVAGFMACNTGGGGRNWLDTTFGTGGKVTTDFNGEDDEAYSVALQADGKILLGGKSSLSANFDFAIARYHTDGSLDTTFGTGGKVTTDFSGGQDEIRALLVNSDGTIVAVGTTQNGTSYRIAMARYLTDGTLDTAFGTGGKVTRLFGAGHDETRTAALLSNGSILLGGFTGNGARTDFLLARFQANGSLDATFGTGGWVTTSVGGLDDQANALAIYTDGKILLGGVSRKNGRNELGLVRYSSTGVPDNIFGVNGVLSLNLGTDSSTGFPGTPTAVDSIAYALSLMPDGKIVVAGTITRTSYQEFVLARLSSTGNLDGTFGTQGLTITSFGTGNSVARNLIHQGDNTLLVTGYFAGSTVDDFAVSRYNREGKDDIGFGDFGKLTTTVGSHQDEGLTLALQSDRKFLIGGRSFTGTHWDFALARFLQ